MNTRPRRISIRLNDEERQQIIDRAKACALAPSVYIRRQALGKQIVSKSDLTTLGEIVRILNELRRLGGLLKNIHNETRGIYSEDTRDAIRELASYSRELARAFLTGKDKENTKR